MKFLKVCLINILFILVITNNIVYASMADFSDEDGEKETQKMIQEVDSPEAKQIIKKHLRKISQMG